jgi:hypothetical protein
MEAPRNERLPLPAIKIHETRLVSGFLVHEKKVGRGRVRLIGLIVCSVLLCPTLRGLRLFLLRWIPMGTLESRASKQVSGLTTMMKTSAFARSWRSKFEQMFGLRSRPKLPWQLWMVHWCSLKPHYWL